MTHRPAFPLPPPHTHTHPSFCALLCSAADSEAALTRRLRLEHEAALDTSARQHAAQLAAEVRRVSEEGATAVRAVQGRLDAATAANVQVGGAVYCVCGVRRPCERCECV